MDPAWQGSFIPGLRAAVAALSTQLTAAARIEELDRLRHEAGRHPDGGVDICWTCSDDNWNEAWPCQWERDLDERIAQITAEAVALFSPTGPLKSAAAIAAAGAEQGDCSRCHDELARQARAEGKWLPTFMIVCGTCGNKRCPKGTDHTLACSGSNEPGQSGSRY